MPHPTPQRLAGVKEAAAEAGKSVITIRRMIDRGVLTGYRDGTSAMSKVLVDLDQLAEVTRPQPITKTTVA